MSPCITVHLTKVHVEVDVQLQTFLTQQYMHLSDFFIPDRFALYLKRMVAIEYIAEWKLEPLLALRIRKKTTCLRRESIRNSSVVKLAA